MGSVSQEGNVGNVNNRGAGDSIEVSRHGFKVGDMVWGKVKSHPWWPGHVYSEELAIPSVRQSKKEGLLLVAFFGDSSYGWFDPSELLPFDSNFAEKSHQTGSRTFVKAVEEAIDEVRRRSALGLSCMCGNKQNFRETDLQGFSVVDVIGYEPGAEYSIGTIKKARESFKPRLAVEFLRELALEPTDEHDDIDFIKNTTIVMCYRKAVYERYDETYDQAFGDLLQVSTHGKKTHKAPLSGRQVFGETVGPTKPNKPKDNAKKDKYLLKRRDQPKDTNTPQIPKAKESSSSPSQPDTTEDPILATFKASTIKNTNIIPESVDLEINTPISSLIHKSSNVKKPINPNEIPSLGINGPEKIKDLKRPAGELTSGDSISPEKNKKKRKKESLIPDDTHKDGGSLMEKVSAYKVPVEDPQRNEVAGELSSGKSVLPEIKKKRKEELSTGNGDSPQMELQHVVENLHSFALDPFYTNNRKLRSNVRRVFLKFRSLVFQKSINSVTANVQNDTRSKSPVAGAPPVKPQVRLDDPTKSGVKRARHEEIAPQKKKKITEIKNSKKVDQDGVRSGSGSGQVVVVKPRKREAEVGQRVAEPTILKMEFPSGGSLPSLSELKTKLGRYGKLDHDGTRVYWKTFTCLVVYKYKADAEVALKSVTGNSKPFGNTNVKYSLRKISDSEPPSRVSDHKPVVEDRAAVVAPEVQLKSILKKSGGEEGGKNTSRVKFSLTRDEKSHNKRIFFQKGVSSSTTQSPPPLKSMTYSAPAPRLRPAAPPPPSASPPPPPSRSSMHYKVPFEPPSLPPPPPPKIDIAQQMVSLLTRCNDVVANVTGYLGYVPYHPL